MAAASEDAAPQNDDDVLRRAFGILSRSLPSSWSASQSIGRDTGSVFSDAVIDIIAPDGVAIELVLQTKQQLNGRDVEVIRERLAMSTSGTSSRVAAVAARYIPPPVRDRLTAAGLGYIDATGNLRIESTLPGLFLSAQGATADPWRGPGRPRGTLKGEPAAKIVRAIADTRRAWSVRELVDAARVSTGAAYRVVDFLEREGIATRDGSGRVEVSDWAGLLRRWGDDYGFVQNNAITRWIAPRGVESFSKIVAESDSTKYAMTGSVAAAEWSAYAPARAAMVYVENSEKAAEAWDLRPAEAGVNVLLAEPAFDVVFDRSLASDSLGIRIASPTQVVVDLMNGPGRNPAEAQELLDWMVRNEASWRR